MAGGENTSAEQVVEQVQLYLDANKTRVGQLSVEMARRWGKPMDPEAAKDPDVAKQIGGNDEAMYVDKEGDHIQGQVPPRELRRP